nr:hypothetical protein [Tanacetum cinerariifolium]
KSIRHIHTPGYAVLILVSNTLYSFNEYAISTVLKNKDDNVQKVYTPYPWGLDMPYSWGLDTPYRQSGKTDSIIKLKHISGCLPASAFV